MRVLRRFPSLTSHAGPARDKSPAVLLALRCHEVVAFFRLEAPPSGSCSGSILCCFAAGRCSTASSKISASFSSRRFPALAAGLRAASFCGTWFKAHWTRRDWRDSIALALWYAFAFPWKRRMASSRGVHWWSRPPISGASKSSSLSPALKTPDLTSSSQAASCDGLRRWTVLALASSHQHSNSRYSIHVARSFCRWGSLSSWKASWKPCLARRRRAAFTYSVKLPPLTSLIRFHWPVAWSSSHHDRMASSYSGVLVHAACPCISKGSLFSFIKSDKLSPAMLELLTRLTRCHLRNSFQRSNGNEKTPQSSGSRGSGILSHGPRSSLKQEGLWYIWSRVSSEHGGRPPSLTSSW